MANVLIAGAKVPYFFISQEKFNFAHFLAKFELVSKSAVFFFPAPEKKNSLLRLSQSVRFKFFLENKMKRTTTFGEKKQLQNLKNGKKENFGKLNPRFSKAAY